MKIQLVLSGTYLFKGKVFQNKDAQGKSLTYTVSKADGDHLLEQRNERDIPYFRRVDDEAPAFVPASKRVEKGGVPTPEAAAEEPVADDSADAPADDEAVSADEVVDDGEEEEEPVAL